MNRKPLALLLVDTDQLQHFNDEFGNSAGDHALFAVAQSLQNLLRPTDIVARLEQDKFAVVLPDSDENGAGIDAARLIEGIAGTVVVLTDQSILPSVTVSIGISEMQRFEHADTLIAAADAALARAKARGGNSVSS